MKKEEKKEEKTTKQATKKETNAEKNTKKSTKSKTATKTKKKPATKQKKENVATKASKTATTAKKKTAKAESNQKKSKTKEKTKKVVAEHVEETPKFKQVKKSKKIYNANEAQKDPRIAKRIKIAIVVAIIAVVAVFSVIFSLINIGNNNILKGISVEGIDVSGLNKEQAIEKLNSVYEEKKASEIEIKYGDYVSAIDLNAIETTYDTEKAATEAISIGRSGNIFVNNIEILSTYLFKKNVQVDYTTNEEITNKTIDDISAKLPGVVEEPSYYREEAILYIEKGKSGISVNKEEFIETIKKEIEKPEKTSEALEIPVENKEPDPIDIDKIHEEVHTEVQDAYYTKDPFELHPEVEGVDFDVEAAKAIITAEDKEEYEIPLTITKPKVTLSDIGTEAFPDRLATFSTKYDASNTDRTTNLRIACQKINGKVLLPGETFSYNKTLGKRTAQAGYRNGGIYKNGKIEYDIGGGICQISSTLYNAVLMSNLEIVERRNHMFVPSYVGAGRDATVSYGSIDFRFKNTRKYPVRIVASIGGGVATVSIYGIKEEQEYTFTFSTRTISTFPPSTRTEVDTSVPEGTVKQAGSNGMVTETYITKRLNGAVVSTKLLSRDTYSAMEKIVTTGGGSGNKTTTTPPAKTEEKDKTEENSKEKEETKKEDDDKKEEDKKIIHQHLQMTAKHKKRARPQRGRALRI